MISKESFVVKKNGEAGFRCFCRHPELIENYDKAMADTKTWTCHHRLEEVFTVKQLKAGGNYYDVEPECLIFLTETEHKKLKHAGYKNVGKNQSEETRKKRSISKKGHKPTRGTLGMKFSEETKAKMRASQMARRIREKQNG